MSDDVKARLKRALLAFSSAPLAADLDWLNAAEVIPPEARALLEAVATSGDSLMGAVKAYRDSLAPKPLEFPGWTMAGDGSVYTRGDVSVLRKRGGTYDATAPLANGLWSARSRTLPEAIAAAEAMLALLSPTGAK